jgi:uncharacterized protein (TIGR02284 family)
VNNNNSTIKSLAEITFDSIEGYRKAADKAVALDLKRVLTDQANKRQTTLDRLNDELARLGEDRVTSGSAAGGLHRMWVEITALFENGDEAAAHRVEEGEDHLAEKFDAALKRDDLDPTTRNVIETAYREVREGERLTDRLAKMYD